MHASGRGLDQFRGVPFYDLDKDQHFVSLAPFLAVEEALTAIPKIVERYGAEGPRRLALGFVYALLERVPSPVFDEPIYEQLQEDFAAELDETSWTYRGVANLRWFRTDGGPYDFGNGVSIRGRSFTELAELGFSQHVLEALSRDWMGMGASSYVMLAETSVPKSPDNVVMTGTGTEWTRAQRLLEAMRLLAPGDVTIGPMWIARASRVEVGLGGLTSNGVSIPTIGSSYELVEAIVRELPPMVSALDDLAQRGYGNSPGNLDLALRSYMATYDRWPPGGDSRVLDAITALEAILGSGTEITFKLSFRVAALLGSDGAQRAQVFEDMKAYYDLRSKLVHGASLKEKHRALLADTERLRKHVRTLLRAFVKLATTENHGYSKQWFDRDLDTALQVDADRSALRAALGLTAPPQE